MERLKSLVDEKEEEKGIETVHKEAQEETRRTQGHHLVACAGVQGHVWLVRIIGSTELHWYYRRILFGILRYTMRMHGHMRVGSGKGIAKPCRMHKHTYLLDRVQALTS
jgi:hypothetical protein